MSYRGQLIDWIDAKCRTWGFAERRLCMKHEGWPESVWARIVDGIPPGNFAHQKFAEVFVGDALEIARVWRVCTERQQVVLFTHYVIPAHVKTKLHKLKLSRETYYDHLRSAHRKMAGALQYPDNVRVAAVRLTA